jgi:hypothetical protein
MILSVSNRFATSRANWRITFSGTSAPRYQRAIFAAVGRDDFLDMPQFYTMDWTAAWGSVRRLDRPTRLVPLGNGQDAEPHAGDAAQMGGSDGAASGGWVVVGLTGQAKRSLWRIREFSMGPFIRDGSSRVESS